MMPSSRALFASGLMKEYGNNGLPPNAVSSCGWLLTIVAGQRIDWPVVAFLILISVSFAIRRKRISNTSS